MKLINKQRLGDYTKYFFEGEVVCSIYLNGTKIWYLNGQRHREDGPAIEYESGYKEWYINGKYQDETYK